MEVTSSKDKFIELAEKAVGGSVEAFTPGNFWVEYLPILRYVPAWLPGGGFQKKFAQWAKESRDLKHLPFSVSKKAFVSGQDLAFVKKRLIGTEQQSGNAIPSVATEMLEELSHLDGVALQEEEDISKNVAAIAYAGKSTNPH